MDVIERLTKQGKDLGYEGETLQTFVMLASHCPEVDTRWSYECFILNFARN